MSGRWAVDLEDCSWAEMLSRVTRPWYFVTRARSSCSRDWPWAGEMSERGGPSMSSEVLIEGVASDARARAWENRARAFWDFPRRAWERPIVRHLGCAVSTTV